MAFVSSQKITVYLRIFILLLLINLLPKSLAFAQDSLARTSSLRGFPVVFYLPETNWSVGATGIYTFRMPQDSSRYPSQLNLGIAYTLNRQFLLYLPFRLYLKKHIVYGELGYYIYDYNFYGIGAQTLASDEEVYGVRFPRVRLTALRQVSEAWAVGLRYWAEDFRITERDPQGQLAEGSIAGSNGSIISGLGPAANYDTRDNIFYPIKGAFAEMAFQYYPSLLGSSQEYSRLSVAYAKYFHKNEKHILALRGLIESSWGNPPFNQMALFGGARLGRAYYEGRYRDLHLLGLQAEYRFPLFWKIGGALFTDVGHISPDGTRLKAQQWRYTLGGGLRYRLNEKEKINLRLDVGFAPQEGSGFYVTIGEAF